MTTKTWFPQINRADHSISLLKNFLFYAELRFSQPTIEKVVSTHPNFPFLSLEDIKSILQTLSINSVSFRYNEEILKEIPTPSLLFIHSSDGEIKSGEFIVFHRLLEDQIEYIHCRRGWVIENLSDFMNRSSHIALSLLSADVTEEENFNEKEDLYVKTKLSRPAMANFKLIDGFLSAEDCEYIISLARPLFKRSRLMEETNIIGAGRTSSTADLVLSDNLQINKLKDKISLLLELPVSHIEDLQVVKYEVGQEYLIHYDTFDPTITSGQETINKSGQRKFTGLLYLNHDFVGGQTFFPNAELLFSPMAGRLLVFKNIDDTGEVLSSALHAGLPVTTGIKYAVNIWVREKPFLY